MSCLPAPCPTWAQKMGSSAAANPINSAPRARSPTLEDALVNSAVQCSCRAWSSAPQRYVDPNEGRILHLPKKLGRLPSWSVRHQQPKLNDDAGGHPCIVSMVSACGHLAFCMQLTSFNGRGIEQKYSDCNPKNRQRIYDGWMPLDEPNTRRINDKPLLSYYGRDRMNKQSYANLEFGYWMEIEHLTTKVDATLYPTSLASIKDHYAAAESYRLVHGSVAEAKFAAARGRSSLPTSPASSRGSSPSSSPPRAPAYLSGPWQRRSPSPPPFVIPQRRNAALTIVNPASLETPGALNSNDWPMIQVA